ncbi:MAG TPA: LamG domain-containing protein, partial [bacterium]|nr:LamG domain-containing protein [bacterium]
KVPVENSIDKYQLLEKLSQKCTVLYDKDCGVIDSNLLSAVKLKLTIQEAVNQGKMNAGWKIARLGDTYETGYTLENIKKLVTYRILPFGFELAARCIAGEIPCADNKIYNNSSGYGFLPPTTLQEVLNGYYDCGDVNISSDDGKFCHLVNPNWVLKAPDYKCESGLVYSPLLTATDSFTESNIRYQYCPDVSSCLSESDNGTCKSFGYCMREKNIWRFGNTADECSKDNVSCTKYTYTFNQQNNEIGLIKDSTDSAFCDETNAGCRKYSIEKTGENPTDWNSGDDSKIYLDKNIESCDFSEEGCTAFIRKDVANLIKNSSFEEYTIPDISNPVIKVADLFIANNYDTYGKAYIDNTNTLDGSWSLYMSRENGSSHNFINYMLDNDNLIKVDPSKTYTLSYYVSGLLNDNNYFISGYGYGAYIDVKEYNGNKNRITSTPLNYSDIDAFQYINNEITNIWTRKKVTFKTSNNTGYLNIIPIISNMNGFVYFDALQLQEGNDATSYKLYEDSAINYLKKAPDYMNCYNSTTSDDFASCSRFAKVCDIRDAGCRKYTKTDDTEFWVPGKPSEANICYSECKNYELYKEQGPSYNKEEGASFKSLISSTATSCDAPNAGCSEYINLSTLNKEYFSSIRGCVKESSLDSAAEYADYFTYTGSETSGFKLNVYRLLRSKYCIGNNVGKKCLNNSDCGYNGSCIYDDNDNRFAPAERDPNEILCNATEYAKSTRDPNCREFHGPKNKGQALNPEESSEYVLYYAKMDSVVPVSENNCQYYEISLEDAYLDKSLCDKISYLPINSDPEDKSFVGRYKYDIVLTCLAGYGDSNKVGRACTFDNVDTVCGEGGMCGKKNLSCNLGIYLPESEICSASQNGCREYKGTSSIAETLFYDNIEKNNLYDWTNGDGGEVTLSRESLFVNESSVKIQSGESIKKNISSYVSGDENINLYKVSLYVKNNATDGSNSMLSVSLGTKEIQKTINNNWRLITFAIYSSTDFANDKTLYISNSSNYDVYVDYIKFEKSRSEYLIKDTWNTPVSCDNDYSNPQGTCTEEYETLGYCTRNPDKICLTGNNIGDVCTTDASVCGDGETCDYPNKYCSSNSDKNGGKCISDSDCFNNPNSVIDGSCAPSISGYRLNLGKMIGCDEYNDPYNNTGYYVFNDLNLCPVDKMGCEAVYDTYNSYSYKQEVYNKINNVTDLYAYYEFDKQNDLGVDTSGNGNNISNVSAVLYSKDAMLGGSLSLGEQNSSGFSTISDNLGDVSSSAKNRFLSLSSWVKPINKLGGIIISRDNSFKLELVSYGNSNTETSLQCSGYGYDKDNGYGSIPSIKTDGGVILNKWSHVACTYDGGRLRLYINGNLMKIGNSNAKTITYNSSSNITIAKNFVGKIDDLRLYKKVLSGKEILDLAEDYKDNIVVPADELKYIIIDPDYTCDAKYKGCTALGRREDRYDNYGDYNTVYYMVNPDKFKSYASSSGINSGSLCQKEAEGCYTFVNGTAKENFRFPKNLCVYRENVDVGYGNNVFKTGWFKYDYQTQSLTNAGCYYTEMKNLLGSDATAKYSDNSYKLYKSNECEYKSNVVVRRDMIYSSNPKPGYGAYPQIAYYIYEGDQRTGTKCSLSDLNDPSKNCKPYGYEEDIGIIDEFTNEEYQFNICKPGSTNAGRTCKSDADCGWANGSCVPPYIVSGWFKTGTTQGCSDNGNNIVESGDYKKVYNGSVGSCSEYGCIEFIEPAEQVCRNGTTLGYPCETNQDCGNNMAYSCELDKNTGNKYCVSSLASSQVNNNGNTCKLNSQCGFGGECVGNNTYTYINNDNIDKTSCTTVSRQEGCVLFNDTSNPNLTYTSEYTYLKSNQNSGRGVAPQVGDNSGGMRQKDSNVIIKVKRDRECGEWLTFGSTDKKFTTNVVDTNNIGTCTELASDGTCGNAGLGWDFALDVNYYKSQMRGEWSNNDFDGFAIYGQKSVDNNWWANQFIDAEGKTIGPSTAITSGTDSSGMIDNLICKKYPEKDSPFNFTDKYATEYIQGYGYDYCSGTIYISQGDCNSACYYADGSHGVCISDNGYKCCIKVSDVLDKDDKGLPFDVYKNKNLRTYFKSVNSGLSVMEHSTIWSSTNPIRYTISDQQECYYQKATYNNIAEVQYYKPGAKIYDEVCQERGVIKGSDNNTYKCYTEDGLSFSKNSKLKEIVDYSKDDSVANYRQGYCLEFDYSQELYYPGSGKYNCINWMPGFIGKQ